MAEESSSGGLGGRNTRLKRRGGDGKKAWNSFWRRPKEILIRRRSRQTITSCRGNSRQEGKPRRRIKGGSEKVRISQRERKSSCRGKKDERGVSAIGRPMRDCFVQNKSGGGESERGGSTPHARESSLHGKKKKVVSHEDVGYERAGKGKTRVARTTRDARGAKRKRKGRRGRPSRRPMRQAVVLARQREGGDLART